MKSIINFINEVHRKEDNSKGITEEDKKSYINYSHKYFEYLNNNDKLSNAIQKTFKYINDNVLKIMNDNHISNFIDKKIIPRIIEYYLANKMSNINKFRFRQSEENSKNKDIYCTKINNKILKEDIFKDIKDIKDINNLLDFFSIELKCTSNSSSITGNRSYAVDKPTNQKKNKRSFYILITYDYFSNKNNENNKNVTIELRNAYFGYIVQDDWIYGNGGNSSRLRIKDLFHSNDNEKNNRIIQII